MNKLVIKNMSKMKQILGFSIALSLTTLTGCGEEAVIEDKTEMYDYIDSNDGELRIKPQEIEVPGEKFKLRVEYKLDEDTKKKWSITANKEISVKVNTEGLEDNTKVWIDTIHTDISTVAKKEAMDGIPQDSIDDHIHNGLMYGFPISDDVNYYANWKIEGMNKDFIEGSYYGFESSGKGEISQKRYTETDYLKKSVYANMIASSYGLLIQKGDAEPYGVDASSELLVLINNRVTTIDDDGTMKTYIYNRDGEETLEKEEKVKVKK